MSRWRYKVLKKTRVLELISKYRSSIRIELTKGHHFAYHLQIKTSRGIETMGRVNNGLIKSFLSSGELIPMDQQRTFINIFDYKFKPLTQK